MVREVKEEANSYMERFSLCIFGVIQIHVGDSSRPVDPPKHEKRTIRKLQRICSQIEECGIIGSTTPHQARGKFYIHGHSSLSVL